MSIAVGVVLALGHNHTSPVVVPHPIATTHSVSAAGSSTTDPGYPDTARI